MNIHESAQKRLYEMVDDTIKQNLEGDDSREFILSMLYTKEDSFFSMFGRSRKTLLQEIVDKRITEIIRECVDEIIGDSFKKNIQKRLDDHLTQDKVYFAGRAAVDEFMDRLSRKLEYNQVSITLEESRDDDDD